MDYLRKLRAIVKFAAITLKGKDDGKFPIQQIIYNGRTAECMVIFPYGMHANLPANSLVNIFAVGAREENLVGLGGLPTERIKNLPEGEVVFFHPKTKSKLHFKNNNDVDIESKGNLNIKVFGDANVEAENVNVTAAKSTFNGDVDITGNLDVGGDTSLNAVTSNDVDISDQHTHDDTQPGSGKSGTVTP